MRLEIRTETDPYKLQVQRTAALSPRRLRYLLLLTPFLFVAFVQSIAQDAMLQSNERNLAGDLRVAFHRSDYRAALALAQEISAIPAPDTGLQEEVLFIKACSASRLQQRDGESFLMEFLERYPGSPRIPAARFELAESYYRNKAYEKVIQQSSAIDLAALSVEQRHAARFYWGYSLFGQKKLIESLPLFDAIKLSSGPYAAAATYYAGFTAFSIGNNAAALSDLRRLESQDSYKDAVPVLIAHILSRQGKADELLAYAKSLESRPTVQNIGDIRLLAAEAYYTRARYSDAFPGYQEYLKKKTMVDTGAEGVFYRAGHTAHQLGKYAEATQWLKPVAGNKDSVSRYASYYLAISFLKTNQKQSALTAFQSAASGPATDPLTPESAFQSAKLLYDLLRADQAIEEMENFLARYPDSPHGNELRELLSGAYVNANNYHKAITHIESLATRTPATDKAYQKAALFYGFEFYNKGELEQAVTWFSKSLAFPFDLSLSAEASVWSGEALAQLGKPADACSQYERVITNAKTSVPSLLRARYGLGYARFNQRQYDKAQVSFSEYVRLADRKDARLSDVLVRLGDCSYVQKSYADAYQHYRKSFETGPAFEDYARMQAGLMLGIQRKYDEAIALLAQVVRTFRSSVYWDEALYQKAQLEFESGRYEDARDDFSYLIQERPMSRFIPFALVRRAAAQFNLKDYPETADDYIRAITDYPAHPACEDVLLPLQEALTLAGRAGEFESIVKQYKEGNPQAKGLEGVEFETAKSLYFSQKYNEAIRSLTAYIDAYPDHVHVAEARFYRAESFYRVKDFASALKSYYELENDRLLPQANRVAARTAELEYKSGQFRKALPAWVRLEQLAQTPKDKFNSWAGRMDAYYQLAVFDSALVFADRLLEDPAAGQLLYNRANLISGKCWQSLGEFDKATDSFLATINDARDEPGAEAKYRLAEIQFLRKDHQGCYETVVSLNQDYGPYEEWTGKGFLLLAESFVATGELFQATATLRSLDKFPLEHIRDEARRRLVRIESGSLNRTGEQDSTDHG